MDIIEQLQALRQELCDIESKRIPYDNHFNFKSIGLIDQLIKALQEEQEIILSLI